MSQLWISGASLIVGIIVTVLVSRYYFQRSVRKSLTPYIQFSSSPLEGIDPEVRKQLEMKYQDLRISDLFEIQFLIANSGDKAIRDVIEPLSLPMPGNGALLDASVLHVTPEGRKIQLAIAEDRKEVKFVIPLLNSGEFFITKILLNGSPSEDEFKFSIVADELPPTLIPVHLPYDSIAASKKREFEFVLLIMGVGTTVIGLPLVKLIYDGWSSLPSLNELGAWGFITSLGLGGWSLFGSIIPAIFFLLFGVLLTVMFFLEGSFPRRKKRFIVPDDKQLLRRRFHFPNIEVEDMD